MGGPCKWSEGYSKTYPGFTAAKNGKIDHCHCILCDKDISIHYKGLKDIEKHVNTNAHKQNRMKLAGTQPLPVYFSGKRRLLRLMCSIN